MAAKGFVKENTRNGHCGSLLVVDTPVGHAVYGIHSLGGAQNLAFTSILMQPQLENLNMIDVGEVNLGEDMSEQALLVKPVEVNPVLNSRDPILFREGGLGKVYGALSTGPSRPKSNVQDTIIRPFFESKGFSTTCVKPVFSLKGWHHGLEAMTSPNLYISSAEAQFVANHFVESVFSKLSFEDKDLIEFYDVETAILGAPGVNHVNALNMKTSLGFPAKKPKTSIFRQIGDKWQIPDEILPEIQKIIDIMKSGNRVNPVASASYKDEAREALKVLLGKIRIFMGSNTTHNIVMRMFYLSLVRLIQRNPMLFETTVGINAHSKQWDTFARKLKDFSSKLIDGDHAEFDKRVEAVMIYEAFMALNNLIIKCMLETGKLKQEEVRETQKFMSIFAADIAFAYIDYNGTLMSFLKGHISGQVLTVIINSMINSMYVRMAYRRITGDHDLKHFHEFILMLSYGDDFSIAVKDCPKFTFASLQQALKTFGVTITPADKNAEAYEYTTLDKIEFLKRRFLYHEDLGRYVGPLNEKSITKSLLIGLRSTSITREEQAISIMMSALREYFFHGKAKYDWFRGLIFECVEACSLQFWFNPDWFPTYENLLEEYRTKDIVPIFPEIQRTKEITHLDEQCEFQDQVKLNAERLRMGLPIFVLDPSRVLFRGRAKMFLHRLRCSLTCQSAPYICSNCQVEYDNQIIGSIDVDFLDSVDLNKNRVSTNN